MRQSSTANAKLLTNMSYEGRERGGRKVERVWFGKRLEKESEIKKERERKRESEKDRVRERERVSEFEVISVECVRGYHDIVED